MIPWGTFPFNKDIKNLTGQLNQKDIQNYVSDIINKYIPPNDNSNKISPYSPSSSADSLNNELQAQVFETFDYVFIRISLPDEDSHKGIRIFHTSNQAFIENIYNEGERHTFVLPSIVKKKGATALVRDQMMEIRIPKADDLNFSEIDVREI